jgi:hypothetical protein
MDSINLNEIHKFLLEIVPRCGDVKSLLRILKNLIYFLKSRLFEMHFIKKKRCKRKAVLLILLQKQTKK